MMRESLLLAIILLYGNPVTAITIDELIDHYGKKAILESIYKKSGKRAHIKTDDGIKLYHLPDPAYTDARTIQRDLTMINMTPEQIELDIQANQQKTLAEQSQALSLYQHYQSLPPEPIPSPTPLITQNTQTTSQILPRYTRRKSGYGKGCGSKNGPGGSRLPNGKCPAYK